MEQAKLLSLTIVLTVLLWAGADSLVNEMGRVRVRFEVGARVDSDMLVEVAPAAASQLFELQVFGPRKVVEKLQTLEMMTFKLFIDDREVGDSVLVLDPDVIESRLALQRKEFESLYLISIVPERLPIVVDRMVTTEATVVAKRVSLTYDDQPTVNPGTVSIRLRESILREIGAVHGLTQIDIGAELERLLRSKPAGHPTAVTVTLDPSPFGKDASIAPARVEVAATVKVDRSTVEISTVPIKPVISFANLAKPLRAVARDGSALALVTQSITVKGPTEDIARLARGETRAFGFVQLKEADLEELGVLMSRIPEFYLPPGISLAQDPVPIEFKLISAAKTESPQLNRPS